MVNVRFAIREHGDTCRRVILCAITYTSEPFAVVGTLNVCPQTSILAYFLCLHLVITPFLVTITWGHRHLGSPSPGCFPYPGEVDSSFLTSHTLQSLLHLLEHFFYHFDRFISYISSTSHYILYTLYSIVSTTLSTAIFTFTVSACNAFWRTCRNSGNSPSTSKPSDLRRILHVNPFIARPLAV